MRSADEHGATCAGAKGEQQEKLADTAGRINRRCLLNWLGIDGAEALLLLAAEK